MYGFLYVADKYEGLVIVGDPDLKSKSPGVGTLLDGNPANNFLKRAADLQSGRNLERGAPHHHRRNLRLHPVRSRPGRGRSRQSRCSPGSRLRSARRFLSTRVASPCSSAMLS